MGGNTHAAGLRILRPAPIAIAEKAVHGEVTPKGDGDPVAQRESLPANKAAAATPASAVQKKSIDTSVPGEARQDGENNDSKAQEHTHHHHSDALQHTHASNFSPSHDVLSKVNEPSPRSHATKRDAHDEKEIMEQTENEHMPKKPLKREHAVYVHDNEEERKYRLGEEAVSPGHPLTPSLCLKLRTLAIPILALLVTFYGFNVTGNITTYRAASTMQFFPPYFRPLVKLPDYGHDFIDEVSNDEKTTTALSHMWIVVIIALVVAIFQKPALFFVATAAIEVFVLAANAIAQLITTLPDALGTQNACTDPRYIDWGTWVYTRISSSYCGDMIWSGHIWHLLFAITIIHRSMVMRKLNPRLRLILVIIGLVLLVVVTYAMLAVRLHYAVDIFLALLVGILILSNQAVITWCMLMLYIPPSMKSRQHILAESSSFVPFIQ